MKSLQVYNLIRLLLNIFFFGLIVFASIDNNDKNLPLFAIVSYNIMIFIPAWINNFVLLPRLRSTKKVKDYLITVLIVLTISIGAAGYYLSWLYDHFNKNELEDFTALAVTSSAPQFLEKYQSYFDAYPGIIVIAVMMAIGYTVQEYLLRIKKNESALAQQRIAELSLLKSQISPHFLFNVLNSLYALSLKMSKETPDVILKLSDILRYSLYESQPKEISVASEIHILHTYIDIERLRMPANATISFQHDDVKETVKIAPMLLLPLIENAFKHGIDSTIDGSYIDVTLSCNDTRLLFKCTNSFKETISKDFGGIGIENIRKRLKLLYPSKHFFSVQKDENIFTVTLEIKF